MSTSARYTASSVYSTGGDAIVSFDRGADGAIYYMTSTPSYTLGGFYRWDGGSTSTLFTAPGSGYYAGASVVSVNDTVHFNYSTTNYYVQGYNTSTEVLGSATETTNYALASGGAANPNTLWVTGSSDWVSTDLSYAMTDSAGALTSGLVSIGDVPGSSGPMQFDSAGNLYYATGYGSSVLYGWSALQVAAAISDPVANALAIADAVLTYDWGADYSGYGGTSLAFDSDGDAYLTLTSFGNPSYLVEFVMDGMSVSDLNEVASSTGRMGSVLVDGGDLYLADNDSIYSVVPVPEPAQTSLIVLGAIALSAWSRRTRRRSE